MGGKNSLIKKLILTLSVLLISCFTINSFAFAADAKTTEIQIDTGNFPDEIFRAYIKTFDLNKNGSFSSEEISKITEIAVRSKGINSLQGIHFFINLVKLDCSWNDLGYIDLSANSKLQELRCYVCKLSNVYLSSSAPLKKIYAWNNYLTAIDVTPFNDLELLSCSGNKISILDTSNNSKLKELSCSENSLTAIDIRKNLELESLSIFRNNLNSLDVSKNIKLKELWIGFTNITSLDVSNNLELVTLECGQDKINTLDITKNTKLEFFGCDNTNLSTLDVSKNIKLWDLDCSNNNLKTLDLSKNVNLESLNCSNNKLKTLDISNNKKLFTIDCQFNELTYFDVSKNPEMAYIRCTNNNLSNFDIRNNKKFENGLQLYAYAYDNISSVQVKADNTVDIAFLKGFDISRISRVTGATVKGTKLVVDGKNFPKQITYTYDMGYGWRETFTLIPQRMKAVYLNTCTITGIENKTYTGNAIAQHIVVKEGSKPLVNGSDYTVSYNNNLNVGTATVTIAGTGNYVGSVSKNFNILKKNYNSSRLSGKNRFSTAISIAKEYSSQKLNAVVLANAYNFPDALAGSSFATQKKAPILLVGNSSNDSETLNYMKANLNTSGTVYLLGGESVITTATVNKIKAAGFKNIVRLGGQNRYATNINIVNNMNIPTGTSVVIANAKSYADSLAISGFAGAKGMPIFLTNSGEISKEVLNKIGQIKPSNIYIIGGETVVSSSVANKLSSYGKVERLGGKTRIETALEIAKKFSTSETSTAMIAYAKNFPDALTGSVLASKTSSPIILVDNEVSAQKVFLDSRKFNKLYILGGNNAVPDNIVNLLSSGK